jgi:hypothetical protein
VFAGGKMNKIAELAVISALQGQSVGLMFQGIIQEGRVVSPLQQLGINLQIPPPNLLAQPQVKLTLIIPIQPQPLIPTEIKLNTAGIGMETERLMNGRD